MKIRLALIGIVGGSLLSASPLMAARAGSGSTVSVGSSAYGKILFAGHGRALYAFTRDAKGGRSTCYGDCATAWPPYTVSTRPRAAAGAQGARLGTVRRRDGRLQATYAGRPLYFYVGDRAPGQVACQNVNEFGGLWLVLRASGALVR